MGVVVFPSSLPSPSVVSMSPAERRLLSSITEGLPQSKLLQADFLGYENLQWEFTAAQALTFDTWWTVTLLEGGRWFQAYWPRVSVSTSGVCRFLLPPKWDLIGHEYWRVTIATELRGAALPPVTAALQLGLHFDGNFTDTAYGHSIGYANEWFSSVGFVPPTFSASAPKFGSANAVFTPYNFSLISDNRGKFIFNLDGAWQISVWLKPVLGAYGYSGGIVFELLSWGHPNGNALSNSSSAPGPYSGQMRLQVQGNSSTASLQFRYPFFNTVSGQVEDEVLADIVYGTAAALPIDGAWHHVGIAGDANGTRLYLDGVLAQTDGDPNPFAPRPAGQRPMWAGTRYDDQRFLISGAFAGSYSSDPNPYSPSVFPFGVAIAVPYSGSMDDLEIRNGSGCVTYVGPTITVPAAPFTR